MEGGTIFCYITLCIVCIFKFFLKFCILICSYEINGDVVNLFNNIFELETNHIFFLSAIIVAQLKIMKNRFIGKASYPIFAFAHVVLLQSDFSAIKHENALVKLSRVAKLSSRSMSGKIGSYD